ncbi:MAG: c-type cytochrome domain-containing protein, partial [Pirellulaceae bacterium]
MNKFPFPILILALLLIVVSSQVPAADDADRLFAVDILPLLKQKCFACHGDKPRDLKGSLDVRSRAGLLKGGESGQPSIVPGTPEKSLLVMAIRWEELEMPPK